MRDVLTSVLDFLGVLAIAVGLGLTFTRWLGPGPGFIFAGIVLIAGSAAASVLARPRRGDV